jgi:hypothetical protein
MALLTLGCVLMTYFLHDTSLRYQTELATLKARLRDLESRTDAIKAGTSAVATHQAAMAAAQQYATGAQDLATCQYRYEGYDLPFMPPEQDMYAALAGLGGRWKQVPERGTPPTGHEVPRHIWSTMKDIPAAWPPYYVKGMMRKNPRHKYHVMNDTDVNAFMENVFAGSALLWTFQRINPRLGAIKADIWRYAVLYLLGGVYVDTDSSFDVALDQWLRPGDGFVVAPENNDYAECYHADFYLHSSSTEKGAGNPNFLKSLPFDKRKLVQWLLVSRPRHPVMHAALRNIVQIVKQLYLRRPLMREASNLGKNVVCSTGPDMLTATTRHVILAHTNDSIGLKGLRPYASRPTPFPLILFSRLFFCFLTTRIVSSRRARDPRRGAGLQRVERQVQRNRGHGEQPLVQARERRARPPRHVADNSVIRYGTVISLKVYFKVYVFVTNDNVFLSREYSKALGMEKRS